MLGRAELAFVIMDIGYVQNSIITTEAFFTLMTIAFVLNVTVPISFLLWNPYFEGSKQLKIKLGQNSYWLSKKCNPD